MFSVKRFEVIVFVLYEIQEPSVVNYVSPTFKNSGSFSHYVLQYWNKHLNW